MMTLFRGSTLSNNETYIAQNYNVDMRQMDDEEKIDFLDKENEKLLSKVLDLTFGLKAVLHKVKEKTQTKPAQTLMHLNDDYKGTFLSIFGLF